MRTVTVQTENLDKEIETAHINQMEFLELKSMITGMGGTTHRQAQQQIWEGRKKQNKTNKPSELEYKSKESIQSEVQREKNDLKKWTETQRPVIQQIYQHMHNAILRRRRESKNGAEKCIKEILVKTIYEKTIIYISKNIRVPIMIKAKRPISL